MYTSMTVLGVRACCLEPSAVSNAQTPPFSSKHAAPPPRAPHVAVISFPDTDTDSSGPRAADEASGRTRTRAGAGRAVVVCPPLL
ncbi:hypothetical protein LX36DRAFT_651663 [Colletotrichum falcatum]|nr:hypothetical protein LX36DRAFT_651663 [Colletotrichum falcatum]